MSNHTPCQRCVTNPWIMKDKDGNYFKEENLFKVPSINFLVTVMKSRNIYVKAGKEGIIHQLEWQGFLKTSLPDLVTMIHKGVLFVDKTNKRIEDAK